MYNSDTFRYRLIAREILANNMSLEEAEYALGVYNDQGRSDVVMEKYFLTQTDLDVILTCTNHYK